MANNLDQPSSVSLFDPSTKKDLAPDTVKAIKRQQDDKTAKRYKISEGKLDFINSRSPKNSSTVTIDLFDGQTLTIDKVRSVERNVNNFTWIGKVRGAPDGQALFSVVDGYLTGNVSLTDPSSKKRSSYSIEPVGENLYSLRENDFTGIADEPSLSSAKLSDTQSLGGDVATSGTTQTQTVQGDSGTSIDVLVLYSNQSAVIAGASMASQAQAAIDATNLAYANSGLPMRLNLVHVEQIPYDEGTGDYNAMLNDITNSTNGAQNVNSLRTTYKADLVSMFVESSSYCGMAWVGSNSSLAFSVVKRTCASSNYSFAHETGHNIGLLHDPAVDSSTYPYAYGHGYVDPACQFRTVMAYPNCGAPRVGYFSNPNITYPGTNSPLGTADVSDSSRVLAQRADTIANFVSSTGTVSCVHSNPTVTITPSAQSGSAGQSLTYQIKTTNNDSTSCASSTFVATPTLPTGFNQTPTQMSFLLNPGGSASQSFVVTSSVTAPPASSAFTEKIVNNSFSSYLSSASATYTVLAPDNTPPSVTISNPTNGSVLPKKGSGKINIQTNASDASGVSMINIYLDGSLLKSCSMTTSCSYSWSYAKSTSGQHVISVTATDNSSSKNQSSTSVNVTK